MANVLFNVPIMLFEVVFPISTTIEYFEIIRKREQNYYIITLYI